MRKLTKRILGFAILLNIIPVALYLILDEGFKGYLGGWIINLMLAVIAGIFWLLMYLLMSD